MGAVIRALQKVGPPVAAVAGNAPGRVLAGTTIGGIMGGVNADGSETSTIKGVLAGAVLGTLAGAATTGAAWKAVAAPMHAAAVTGSALRLSAQAPGIAGKLGMAAAAPGMGVSAAARSSLGQNLLHGPGRAIRSGARLAVRGAGKVGGAAFRRPRMAAMIAGGGLGMAALASSGMSIGSGSTAEGMGAYAQAAGGSSGNMTGVMRHEAMQNFINSTSGLVQGLNAGRRS